MDREEIAGRVNKALIKFEEDDRDLLVEDASERSITTRLAMYLQEGFPEYVVDTGYGRKGDKPGALGLPEECANNSNRSGEPVAVPEIIVHRRGYDDKNLLVLEVMKTTDPGPDNCRSNRLRAFRESLQAENGAVIEFETRADRRPHVFISEWL